MVCAFGPTPLSFLDDGRALVASLWLAGFTALLGSAIVALTGWLVARKVGAAIPTQLVQGLAMLPVAVPGLVLGLGYIFFFNHPENPLAGLYGSMTLLVLCTVIHLYTSAHLNFVTALKAIPAELEAAGADAEAVIRTGLVLQALAPKAMALGEWPNAASFEKLLVALRRALKKPPA